MSEVEFLKCPCKECGNNIEFPKSAAGNTVACPHCGQWTELTGPPQKSETPGISVPLLPLVGGFVLLAIVAGGGIWFWKHPQNQPAATTVAPKSTVKVASTTAPKPAGPAANTSEQADNSTVAQAAPKTPSRPKSPDDLKAGAVQLEKTKGSSLVYAIGTVKNESDYDRYGVRIELDLINGKGHKVGTAKDYKDFLAPHQEWQFHALVTDPKTVKAEVATLKEDQ